MNTEPVLKKTRWHPFVWHSYSWGFWYSDPHCIQFILWLSSLGIILMLIWYLQHNDYFYTLDGVAKNFHLKFDFWNCNNTFPRGKHLLRVDSPYLTDRLVKYAPSYFLLLSNIVIVQFFHTNLCFPNCSHLNFFLLKIYFVKCKPELENHLFGCCSALHNQRGSKNRTCPVFKWCVWSVNAQ